jgi:hypothetical protein
MFHRNHIIATVAFGLAFGLGGNLLLANTDHFYGRWTVSDDKPVYSSKGKLYRTIDVSPCGKDFCGVSVDDNNHCGPTLFRFLTTHGKDEGLKGHGVWGTAKKKLEIADIASPGAARAILIGLGENDMDITGREGSMPTFQANYKIAGKVICTAQ